MKSFKLQATSSNGICRLELDLVEGGLNENNQMIINYTLNLIPLVYNIAWNSMQSGFTYSILIGDYCDITENMPDYNGLDNPFLITSGSTYADYDEDGTRQLDVFLSLTNTTGETVNLPDHASNNEVYDLTPLSELGGTTTPTTSNNEIHTKINGVWKKGVVYIKVNGAWKKAKKVFKKINGAWKQAS